MSELSAPAPPGQLPHERDVLGSTGLQWPTSPARVQAKRAEPPLRWHEPICLLVLVALADLTIYRGTGFAGYSLLFVATPILFAAGMPRQRSDGFVWVLAPMMLLIAARLLWCGSGLTLAVGFAVLLGIAMTLAGQRPYLPETLGILCCRR